MWHLNHLHCCHAIRHLVSTFTLGKERTGNSPPPTFKCCDLEVANTISDYTHCLEVINGTVVANVAFLMAEEVRIWGVGNVSAKIYLWTLTIQSTPNPGWNARFWRGQAWWYTAIITALGRLRQENRELKLVWLHSNFRPARTTEQEPIWKCKRTALVSCQILC